MTPASGIRLPVAQPSRFYIDGEWRNPSSADTVDVIDPSTEQTVLTVARARAADMSRAVGAARQAFDTGPWPRMPHAERATYLRRLGEGLRRRNDDLAEIWPRESGVLHKVARPGGLRAADAFDYYAALADSYPFEEPAKPTEGAFGLLVREPVGVVGAIIPWNAPLMIATYKVAPALLAGCTVVLKPSPEAPGDAYVLAEIADEIGLPPGVLNVLTADRDVSELLVTDPRVDKIAFTGSTAAGRRIASLCGQRIARYTLELGGKSAAVVLDDMDIETAAETLVGAECLITGQVCASLTRIIVTNRRHDELVSALADGFRRIAVGDPFDEASQMGPLAMRRQLERVEGYIARGIASGAVLATGGGRPKHLERGFYIEPTVFGRVENGWAIAQEEIFGPVLSVIPAESEQDAIRIANDTIYGLNASVFTNDTDRAREVARELRSGTVGHNAFRSDFGVSFGGFKQSGIGREGGTEGLLPYLETKFVILENAPSGY
jgi:aldehyde dehydrogenase (NAD+)